MFERSYASGDINDFRQRVLDNALRLQTETGLDELTFPVAILLVLDRANGGNDLGEELVRRFNLIDMESRDIIDFFFFGWGRRSTNSTDLTFDLVEFNACHEALKRVGVRGFGGYADLLLFDVWLRNSRVILDFEHALHIDLVEAVAARRITNVGSFIGGLLQAVQDIRNEDHTLSTTTIVSIRLGLATARRSLIDYLLERWGKIVGAASLVALTPRRIAPEVDLARI
jgi:hypothetical protein